MFDNSRSIKIRIDMPRAKDVRYYMFSDGPTVVAESELEPMEGPQIDKYCGCIYENYCVDCKERYPVAVMKQTIDYGDPVCPKGHIDYIYDVACEHQI